MFMTIQISRRGVEPRTWIRAMSRLNRYCPLIRCELSRGEFRRKRGRCRWWSAEPREQVPIAKSVEREDSESRPVRHCGGPMLGGAVKLSWSHWQRCRVRWREEPCWLKEIEFERCDGDEARRCMASWNGESMSSLANRKDRSRSKSVEVKSPWWRLGIGDPRREDDDNNDNLAIYVSTWWEQAKKWVAAGAAKEMRGRFGPSKHIVTIVWLDKQSVNRATMLILEWLPNWSAWGERLPKHKQERCCLQLGRKHWLKLGALV